MPAATSSDGGKIRFGIRLMACGAIVFGTQAAMWVAQGDWTPLNLYGLYALLDGLCLRLLATHWPPAPALVELMVHVPLAALLAGIGFAIAWTGAGDDALERERRGPPLPPP